MLGFSCWNGINSFVQFVSPQIIMVMFRYFIFLLLLCFYFSLQFFFEGGGGGGGGGGLFVILCCLRIYPSSANSLPSLGSCARDIP